MVQSCTILVCGMRWAVKSLAMGLDLQRQTVQSGVGFMQPVFDPLALKQAQRFSA